MKYTFRFIPAMLLLLVLLCALIVPAEAGHQASPPTEQVVQADSDVQAAPAPVAPVHPGWLLAIPAMMAAVSYRMKSAGSTTLPSGKRLKWGQGGTITGDAKDFAHLDPGDYEKVSSSEEEAAADPQSAALGEAVPTPIGGIENAPLTSERTPVTDSLMQPVAATDPGAEGSPGEAEKDRSSKAITGSKERKK